MKTVKELNVSKTTMAIVADMPAQDLDELETAIHARRLQLMAARLEANGFTARAGHGDTLFNAILAGLPAQMPGVWATLAECRRLLDTVRNLPPAEAFARWRQKIQPAAVEPYTEGQARADVRRERADLRRRYEAGEIDSGMYADLYKAARTYLDLAEK